VLLDRGSRRLAGYAVSSVGIGAVGLSGVRVSFASDLIIKKG
jgi:hypothetical protein